MSRFFIKNASCRGADAGITAYRALFSIGQAKAGTKVGIAGVVGLGQFALQMALIKGCEVYATDISPAARELAKELVQRKCTIRC